VVRWDAPLVELPTARAGGEGRRNVLLGDLGLRCGLSPIIRYKTQSSSSGDRRPTRKQKYAEMTEYEKQHTRREEQGNPRAGRSARP
jgi:hypothetical protein